MVGISASGLSMPPDTEEVLGKGHWTYNTKWTALRGAPLHERLVLRTDWACKLGISVSEEELLDHILAHR